MKNTKNKTLMNESTTLSTEQVASFENEGNFVPEKKEVTPEKKGCRCVQNVHKKYAKEWLENINE